MTKADWYFDFISPYSYLQCEVLARGALPGVSIRYRPVLFAGLLKHWGHKGPAEIPAKRRMTYRFVTWQAKRLGIPFKFPPQHPFNPLALLRLALVADCTPEAVRTIFRSVWREGKLADSQAELHVLFAELDISDGAARVAAPEIKEALKRNTDEAIARGVFGVPTLAIGDELFWGLDATVMAAEYAAAGCRFVDPDLARAVAVPVGVVRN